jgi:hypothetical protein
MGTQTCERNGEFLAWGTCQDFGQPSEERCGNDIDDDCDGRVDEDCECDPGATRSCYTGPDATRGVGQCSTGTETCREDGSGWSSCENDVTPATEQCGTPGDEDCDGMADCEDPDCQGTSACTSSSGCEDRIESTGNEYIPRQQCFDQLEQARMQCNADSDCVLTGWIWGYDTDGVDNTGACHDGGNHTGLRQWRCSPRDDIPDDHRAI